MTPELATIVILLVLATAVLTALSDRMSSETEAQRLARRMSMSEQDVERQALDDLWLTK